MTLAEAMAHLIGALSLDCTAESIALEKLFDLTYDPGNAAEDADRWELADARAIPMPSAAKGGGA